MRHTIISALKVSALAIVLSFGISYALAWTAPTTTPPGGNVSAPINTSSTAQIKIGDLTIGSATIAGKITAYGDICSVIAGVTKCLSTTAAMLPAATLSGTPATCTIASGASTCSVSLTWNIVNATTPNVYNSTKGIQISPLATSTSFAYIISNGANSIQARDGSTLIGTAITETGNCTGGTLWNGSSCAPTTATIVATVPNGATSYLGIQDNQSATTQKISWTVSNAASPNIFNGSTGVVCATGIASSGSVNCPVSHGVNSFYVRDGTNILTAYVALPATPASSVTVMCVGEPGSGWGGGGTWWNGSICDPAYVQKASMPTARGYSSAASVYNKVYIIGGTDAGNIVTGKVEEYDPATNSWLTKTSMITPRYTMSTNAVGNKIYAMAGVNSSNVRVSLNEVYDPASNTWATKLSNPFPTKTGNAYALVSAAVGTNIYSFDAYYNTPTGTWLYYTNIYDTVNNVWTKKLLDQPHYTSTQGAVTASVGSKIYAIGSATGICTVTISGTVYQVACGTNYVYDTSNDTWATKAPMINAAELTTASVVNGKIYVIGGRSSFNNGCNGWNQEYNPATDTWRSRYALTQSIGGSSAVVNNKIYVIGGTTGWACSTNAWNFEYDPAKDLTP